MTKNKEEYVVITINTNKVGYYIFSHFDLANIPQFNQNHCLYNYKVYKCKSAAERTANRIREHYTDTCGKRLPYIITKVLTTKEWADNEDCWQMEKFMKKVA